MTEKDSGETRKTRGAAPRAIIGSGAGPRSSAGKPPKGGAGVSRPEPKKE